MKDEEAREDAIRDRAKLPRFATVKIKSILASGTTVVGSTGPSLVSQH